MFSSLLPTPNTSHLTARDYEMVYEPAEDSFLMLDALESEKNYIEAMRPLVCLEVGTGSGVCITFLAKILGENCLYLGTDINIKAAEASKKTGEVNGAHVETIVMDLVTGFSSQLWGSVDVLVCNPPYVVTPTHEVGSKGIEASWAGGDRGREVTDRLLPDIPKLLSPNGIFYLLIIKENDQDDLEKVMRSHGFCMELVKERRTGPEFLSILKFTRLKTTGQLTGD